VTRLPCPLEKTLTCKKYFAIAPFAVAQPFADMVAQTGRKLKSQASCAAAQNHARTWREIHLVTDQAREELRKWLEVCACARDRASVDFPFLEA